MVIFERDDVKVSVCTSVAVAKASKISVPRGFSSHGGKDPNAAAAPLFTATLGSDSSPRYFAVVRLTASSVAAASDAGK